MNAILDLFHSPWITALGYTLLNSLWQALIIVAAIVMLLRFVPSKFSNARYVIAATGLILILCFSLGTYIYFLANANESPVAHASKAQLDLASVMSSNSFPSVSSYLAAALFYIKGNIPVFMLLWMLGTLFFALRILAGLLFVQKLRQGSVLLQNEWTKRIHQLATRLKIARLVRLAESSAIQAPVIIGYLKPIILIPIGMTSSLSTEQIETIFLHELMHVRRKDYLINLIQSCVEAVYFFNPFVWVVSGMIKREREHCCDDAVVHYYGNAKAYVNALATLEELRLSKAGLCLGLAENKNQLLHRIKRLMERSVKNYSSRERIIPALLLVIGLICASWISTQTQDRPAAASTQPVASDTTKKDKKGKLDKKQKAAKQEEKAAKKTEKSEELSEKSNLGVPPSPVPDIEPDADSPPDLDVEAMIPPVPDINALFESFNGAGLIWRGEHDWEEFSKEFEANFKNKFEDFYAKHEKDIEQMMKEAHEKVEKKFDDRGELSMEEFSKRQEALARANALLWEQAAKRMAERHEMQAILQAERSQERMQQLQEQQLLRHREFEKNQAAFEERMKAFEEKHKRFEAELVAELIKDGYLQSDEKLKNMHWHNGQIEINGKKIKPEHEKKYNELREKYALGIGPRP